MLSDLRIFSHSCTASQFLSDSFMIVDPLHLHVLFVLSPTWSGVNGGKVKHILQCALAEFHFLPCSGRLKIDFVFPKVVFFHSS